MVGPLPADYQAKLLAHPHRNDIATAITDAGIGFENNNLLGFVVSDVPAAQTIIDTEAAWLPIAKAVRLAEVSDLFAAKIAAGVRYTGPDGVSRVFQIDPESQNNINALSNAALGAILNGEPWPNTMFFLAADNTMMPLPAPEDMRNFGVAAKNYVFALRMTSGSLKAAIAQASSASALDAIDINAGWPSN